LFCVSVSLPTAGRECAVDWIDDSVSISQVFDGDTVQLMDGRKVRLLGINAPELNHGQGDDEPLVREARRQLKRIIAGATTVGLRYGERRHDHYGRVLAHVIVDERRDVQQILLERGLAMAITIAPNLWNQECYQLVEDRARQQGRRVWGLDDYQPLSVDNRRPQRGGFRLLRGHIRHVG